MARLPKHGTAFGAPNENDATIADIVVRLGFRKLTRSQEKSFRESIGFAIGTWLQSGATRAGDLVTVKELDALLSRMATSLQEAVEVLSAVRGGFQHTLHVEAAARIANILVQSANGESIREGYDKVAAFLDLAGPIAESAREAAARLRTIRGRKGRTSQDWYAKFVDVIAALCERNGIKPTLSTHRETGASGGKFLAAVEAFEPLLPRRMRSPSRDARVQRLRRWRRRVRTART